MKPDYTLAALAFTSGATDALGFLKLGGILPSAMTGNTALLALYAAAGHADAAAACLVALGGFILGVMTGTLLVKGRSQGQALTMLLIGETSLLLGFALICFYNTPFAMTFVTTLLIISLATSMGLQTVSGKRLNLAGIPTVVFTSTLANIVTSLTESAASKAFRISSDTKRQIISFLLYFTGAFAGGALLHYGVAGTAFKIAIWLPLAGNMAALAAHLSAK